MKKLKVPRYIQWVTLTGIIFLLLMTLLRLTVLLTFPPPAQQNIPVSRALFLGFRYDLRIVSIACLIIFLIGTIKPLHPFEKKWGKRISLWLWTLFVIVFAVFYSVDFANFAYLYQRMGAGILNYLDDAKISMTMVWQTYHVTWIIIGLVIFVLVVISLIVATYNFILSKRKYATKGSRIFWGILFFLLLAFNIFGRFGQYPLRWSDAFSFNNDYASNLALNPFQSFFSSLAFRHASYDSEETKKAYPIIASYLGIDSNNAAELNYERNVVPDDTLEIKPNVVLVICESFSAYKSSMYGNPLNTTPFFNSLCEKGVFFNRCFTPSYGTARGVWATLTGIPDVDFINTSSRNPMAVDQHTIINDFKGYEKFYFIGGSTSWANIRGLLTNNIKDLHLYEQDDYDAPKIDVWGISDKNLFLSANKILASQRKPFFAVIQTADNHRPYTIPEEDRKEFKVVKVPKDSLKKYGFESLDEYNAFRYTDFCYQKFMQAASSSPYYKNTLFVFVGDHGIRGDVGNMFTQAWTDELSSEHVPLLFYSPSLLPHKEYSFISSQIDILPTIAGICKIPYRNTSLGRDLLSERILADSGKTNIAFIADYDSRRIGIVKGKYYYSYGLMNSSPENMQSIDKNNISTVSDSLKSEYRKLTDAFYQTSKYLLLNNKKK